MDFASKLFNLKMMQVYLYLNTVKLLIQAGSLIQAGGLDHCSNRSWVSNTSRVQAKPGVHLVPTYDTKTRFVLNNYDKTARIRHRISITVPHGK